MRRKQRETLVNLSPQRLFFVYIYIRFHSAKWITTSFSLLRPIIYYF